MALGKPQVRSAKMDAEQAEIWTFLIQNIYGKLLEIASATGQHMTHPLVVENCISYFNLGLAQHHCFERFVRHPAEEILGQFLSWFSRYLPWSHHTETKKSKTHTRQQHLYTRRRTKLCLLCNGARQSGQNTPPLWFILIPGPKCCNK